MLGIESFLQIVDPKRLSVKQIIVLAALVKVKCLSWSRLAAVLRASGGGRPLLGLLSTRHARISLATTTLTVAPKESL